MSNNQFDITSSHASVPFAPILMVASANLHTFSASQASHASVPFAQTVMIASANLNTFSASTTWFDNCQPHATDSFEPSRSHFPSILQEDVPANLYMSENALMSLRRLKTRLRRPRSHPFFLHTTSIPLPSCDATYASIRHAVVPPMPHVFEILTPI